MVKKNRVDEPIQAILHIYMEMSQGKSLCSHLKQAKKTLFCFTKSENKKAERVLPGALVPVGWGGGRERVWEGEYSANTVYTCM
jgi:hypothetical protein